MFRINSELLIMDLFRNLSKKSVLYWNSSYNGVFVELPRKICEISYDSSLKYIVDEPGELTSSRSSASLRGATHV